MGTIRRLVAAALIAALTVVAPAPRVAAHGGSVDLWMMATVPLPANDVAYDATRDVLLVAVQPQHPSLGNELVELDPVNGVLGRRVLVGSDPSRVVVTDDGSTAYVALGGANEIVRIDLATFTVAARIDTGLNELRGPRVVDDIDVLPGRNDLVVATLDTIQPGPSARETVAFEDDVALPVAIWSGIDRVEGISANTFFGVDSGFALEHGMFTVDETGVTGSPAQVNMTGVTGDIEVALGRAYTTTGRILDPATGAQVGSFAGYGLIEVTPDGMVTVVSPGGSSVSVFDATTGATLASSTIVGIPASTSLVATGSGFALASGSAGVTLLGTVVSSAGFTAPQPPPSGIADLEQLALPYRVNDAVYDQGRDLLYASVAATSPHRPNQVVAIDPETGSVVDSIGVGGDPGALAIDEAATQLHVGRRTAHRIDTIDLAGFTSVGSFPLGQSSWGEPVVAAQIVVRPGTSDELVVALEEDDGRVDGAALFVDGARRPSVAWNVSRTIPVDGSTMWGSSDFFSSFVELAVDDDGLQQVSLHKSMAFGDEPELHDGRIYASSPNQSLPGSQAVLDPEGPSLVGTLPYNGPVVADRFEPRVYVFESMRIREVDTESLRTVGTFDLGAIGATRSAVSMQVDGAQRFAVLAEQLVLVTTRYPGTGTFHPIPPARVADSRSGLGLPGRLVAGTPRDLQVTGVGGVPSSGVSAVVVNLTSVGSTASSHVTAWPAGLPVPSTSNVNFAAGSVVANQAIIPVGAGGRISALVGAGSTHLVVDVQGWFGDGTELAGARLNAIRPARLADTRSGVGLPSGRLAAGTTASVQVTGRGGVPAAGVTAVVVNLTSVGATASGHLTAWPTGQPRPGTSNLNFRAGSVVANQAIIPVGAGGRISLAVGGGATHVVVDVQGWFGPAGAPTGGLLHTTTPGRIVDTRVQLGLPGILVGGAVRSLGVAGTGGVPPSGATAVVANLTVVRPPAPGHLTAWAAGQAPPSTSNVNFTAGQVVANQAFVPLSGYGAINLASPHTSTHLVIDVQGWFGPAG